MADFRAATHGKTTPQTPFDAAVVIPTTLRPSLLQAVRSVFAQDWPGRIQILIGLDVAQGDRGIVDRLVEECPDRMAITFLDLGYSTSIAHGGTNPNPYGGTLRTVLSYASNSERICYLDDDNWLAPNHVGSLLRAIEGFDWAFAYRWFVDPVDDSVLCLDDFESVGPARGIHKRLFNGFVDTNCLMVDRRACMEVFPNWSLPLVRKGQTDGTGEDRRIFDALWRNHSVGWTGTPSVYYRIDLHKWQYPVHQRIFRQRNITPKSAGPQKGNAFTRQRELAAYYLHANDLRKLNVGAGPDPLPGWLNTASEPEHPEVFRMDAGRTFPFADAQFHYVATDRLIERLSFRDGPRMLQECFRVLLPGGKLRVATCDLRRVLALFDGDVTEGQRRYMYRHLRGRAPDAPALHPVWILNTLFDDRGSGFYYDERVLGLLMRDIGFVDIRRFQCGVSSDPELTGLEQDGLPAGDAAALDYETLVLEGTKPD